MTDVLDNEGWKVNSIGEKFGTDGRILPFRGNTILCHIPTGNVISGILSELSEYLQRLPLSRCYSFLPIPSYHMTVMNGANDQARKYPDWPTDLPLDCSMNKCDELFTDKLSTFSLNDEMPTRMKIGGIAFKKGVSLRLAPVHDADNQRIRALRDRLSKTLQCRRYNHETFEFHISLSYLISHPSLREITELQIIRAKFIEKLIKSAPVIELGPPEFCVFHDMYKFNTVFHLK